MKFRKKKKKSSPTQTLNMHQWIHLRDSEAKKSGTVFSLEIPPSTCIYTHIYTVLFIYGVILVNPLNSESTGITSYSSIV